MKKTLFIFFTIITSFTFGQNLSQKVGKIEVQLIEHYFKRNSDYELTKRKSNRKNRPHTKMYFDSSGILLKKIGYGKHHNTDLRLTDRINVYSYEKGKLIKSIEYKSDYQKNIYPYWKSKYIYNDKGQLIDESTYYHKNDSLFFKTTFEYDLDSNRVKSIVNPTYFYKREFDSINRITSIKQIYDNKLRWEWTYTYSDNKRIGIFQTYYNDGKDYPKKEIQTFNSKGLLIESEEKHISKSGLDQKTKLFYNDYGIVTKIEKYESYGFEEGYELVSYTKIKIKSKVKIDFQIAKNINEQIEIK